MQASELCWCYDDLGLSPTARADFSNSVLFKTYPPYKIVHHAEMPWTGISGKNNPGSYLRGEWLTLG